MNLLALPAFNDNCIWMLHDGSSAIVVDPGDSAPVIAALAAQHLTLAGILVTHHHADHVGTVDELRHLQFTRAVEPENEHLAAYTRRCETQRANGLPTVTGAIAQEQSINPFLRCVEPAVVQAARRHGAVNGSETEVFAALRHWKNDYR